MDKERKLKILSRMKPSVPDAEQHDPDEVFEYSEYEVRIRLTKTRLANTAMRTFRATLDGDTVNRVLAIEEYVLQFGKPVAQEIDLTDDKHEDHLSWSGYDESAPEDED